MGVTITDVSPEENNRKLAILNGRAMDWARKHSSIFDFDKYQLVHFQGRLHTGDKGPDLYLPGFHKPVKATEDCKYLGVVLDRQLKFHKHLRDMEKKATARLSALQVLTGSAWGISMDDTRNIYRSTILPLFLYCATVWYIPSGGFGYKTQQNQAIKTLKGVQKRAAQIIGGT